MKPDVRPRIGIASVAISLAAAASPWTGLKVAGLNLSDWLLAAAAILAILEVSLHHRRMPVPAWAVIPIFIGLLVFALQVIFMDVPIFVTLETSQSIQGSAAFADQGGGVVFLLRLALATTITAVLAYSEVVTFGTARAKSITISVALGCIISASVAITDSMGLTGIRELTFGIISERPVGLTFHPNSLAASLVLAIPLVLYLQSVSTGAKRGLWRLSLPILVYGLLIADSRAGLVVGAAVFACCIFVLLRGTRWRKWILPLLLAAVVVLPIIVGPILANTRLATLDFASDQSAIARMNYLTIGLSQFETSPFIGVGLGGGSGVAVPLLIAASGGSILLVAYYLFVFVPTFQMIKAARARRDQFLSFAVLASIGFVAFGLFNNGYAERYGYWVLAAGAAVAMIVKEKVEAEQADCDREGRALRPG